MPDHLIRLSTRQNDLLNQALESSNLSPDQVFMLGIHKAIGSSPKSVQAIKKFIDEDFIKGEKAFTPVSDFKHMLKNKTGMIYTQKDISRAMRQLGYETGRPRKNGVQVRAWAGLKPRDSQSGGTSTS